MHTYVSGLLACCFLFSVSLPAAEVKGKVVDGSGAPVRDAQVSVVNRLGVEAQTVTGVNGGFQLDVPLDSDTELVVAAAGFSLRTTSPGAGVVQLEIAPVVDSVRVVGSAIDVLASEQGGSVSLVTSEEVRQRNEPFAVDLLRYLPGMVFNQSGGSGGVANLFLRGGNSNFSLVRIDGVPVVGFGGGLGFDFAHLPSESIDHIDVIRGPQSAIYGPYANSGVIDVVTRMPEGAPAFDVLAEGGSHNERRFGLSGSGMVAGFGIAAAASRFDGDGLTANNDYRNENITLNVRRRFGRHSLSLHGDFDSNDVGEPGAWGSDPAHTFTGLDLVSRAHNDFSNYAIHYQGDLAARVRQELTGSFFLDNNGFRSPYGFSFNKDIRGQAESHTIVSVTPHYTAAFGASVGREEVKNTFITDTSFDSFPIRRDDLGVYLENRFEIGGKLFLNAGVRGEFFRTHAIPSDGFSRPLFPENTVSRANPKFAATYLVAAGTRVHASFGTGIRPPSGFELAFTNNPALQPEKTRSLDAGIEQKVFKDRLLLDATYFYNRYYDLIVTLGGSLATLSHYQSDNLANSRAEGGEFSANLRPARWLFVRGSYTLLATRILSLDGAGNLAPRYFAVGQPLTRRPRNSGNFVATVMRGRVSADFTGYFRGRALFEEPSFGASNGLFWNDGYSNIGVNLNYRVGRGVTIYGNLRNALNQQYEEVFGYPSPRLNFVAGMKYRIGGRQ